MFSECPSMKALKLSEFKPKIAFSALAFCTDRLKYRFIHQHPWLFPSDRHYRFC
ncbi:MAG: hypothetical protein ICV63_06355 [Coleofasciculus sp. Co-bin14]|nr:hypothetical protein [Coleofasciculus sp. Co-bin14]